MRTIGSRDLFGRKRVARVVLDGKYPDMWRVQRPDGSLTDMVNLTRAKDAAMALAVDDWLNDMSEAA